MSYDRVGVEIWECFFFVEEAAGVRPARGQGGAWGPFTHTHALLLDGTGSYFPL